MAWIEVPEGPLAPHQGGPLDADLVALNDAVAALLGCELVPWSLRDVESLGSAAGEPDGDWLHPTARGGGLIAAGAAALTTADACIPA